MKTMLEHYSIKRYYKYIIKRLKYIDVGLLVCEPNEYKFYSTLLKRIKQWGQNNPKYFRALIGKIDMNTLCLLGGREYGGNTWYSFHQVKDGLCQNILCWEEQLLQQYPFNPAGAKYNVKGFLMDCNEGE